MGVGVVAFWVSAAQSRLTWDARQQTGSLGQSGPIADDLEIGGSIFIGPRLVENNAAILYDGPPLPSPEVVRELGGEVSATEDSDANIVGVRVVVPLGEVHLAGKGHQVIPASEVEVVHTAKLSPVDLAAKLLINFRAQRPRFCTQKAFSRSTSQVTCTSRQSSAGPERAGRRRFPIDPQNHRISFTAKSRPMT